MRIIGLTGSIGMGKSTTADLFRQAGVPVNDADTVVHHLYAGEAVEPVSAAFPGTVKDGVIDRQELSRQLASSPEKFKILESIVHPLVRKKETEFLASARASGASLVVLDIPLLFETGGEERVDTIVVVTCSPELQKERVMQRHGMTEEKFNLILARQVADSVKRTKADYIIDTGHGLDAARKSVDRLISELRRTDQDTDRHA